MLWLAAALAAIAFSLANTVRGETERTATGVDGVRAYYLASGSIDRATLHMLWRGAFYEPGMPYLRFNYPGGEALVEIIPESSKLNLNQARPEELHRLMVALGIEPERAYEIAMAIVDWRRQVPPGTTGLFDSFYLARVPSFPARHASVEEIEEILLVKGMTPELFYGGYGRDADGRLVPQPGLRDCVSVYGGIAGFDVNTVEPALMAALGVSPELTQRIVETRRATPFRKRDQVLALAGGPAQGLDRLGLASGTIFTLRATARPRTPNGQLSDLRRTVAALVKIFESGSSPPSTVLRWYDNAAAPARWF